MAAGGPPRPGGGTYPVRAAASAAHRAAGAAPEPPARKPPRPFVPYARDSAPRVVTGMILVDLWLLTFVLVLLSVRSYLPEVDWTSEPVSEPADDALPDS